MSRFARVAYSGARNASWNQGKFLKGTLEGIDYLEIPDFESPGSASERELSEESLMSSLKTP